VLNIKIKISLIFFISIVNYVFLHLIHDANWITLVEASFDVANRTPHWRVNQSRLMGPILLKLITLFGFISEQWALRLFMMFFVTFNNLLLAVCLSNMTNSKQKILNTLIIFNALLIISQDVWLYVWDFIDISFFIFYGFILFKEEYIKYLVPINFLHIFNRESALIMAVFFLLLIYTKDKNLTKLFKKNYVIGLIFNLTFGVLYTYFSRKILFIRQSDYTGGGQDLENNFLGGNWVTPLYNYNSLYNGETLANTLILLSLLLVFIFIFKNYKSFESVQKNLSLGIVINILPVFIFGIFTETRQYFPSLVLLTYLIFSKINLKQET
tara:strand:- start:358 stop:1335 length:978 start_codon:yes stop_codon:yes gene_type:complete